MATAGKTVLNGRKFRPLRKLLAWTHCFVRRLSQQLKMKIGITSFRKISASNIFDLNYLMQRTRDISLRNILGGLSESETHIATPPAENFDFMGYDLVGKHKSVLW